MSDENIILRASNICKSFKGNEVLRDVSFEVERGSTVSILGPSGSGKSTLLRCLNLLERADGGEIYLDGELISEARDGKPLTERELSKIRTRMSMVFQSFNLWPHFNVLQNIIEAPVHVKGVPRDEAISLAESLLSKVGLSDKRDAYPYSLSGGQKQRVAIARALAMAPGVILFDEPTSALDPELVGEVLGVMRELAEEGITMIVVTHEMKFARDVCEKVIFMDNGRIVEAAESTAFFSAPQTERARQFLMRFNKD